VHDGDHTALAGDSDLWAIPYSALWSIGDPVRVAPDPGRVGALSAALAEAESRARQRITAVGANAVRDRVEQMRAALPGVESLLGDVALSMERLGLEVSRPTTRFGAADLDSAAAANDGAQTAHAVISVQARTPDGARTGELRLEGYQFRIGTTQWSLMVKFNSQGLTTLQTNPLDQSMDHVAAVESLLVEYVSGLEQFVERFFV
jgi:hypothetical protein